MNGASVMPPVAIGNPVVDLLSALLNDAKAGKIGSVGLVVVPPQGGCAPFWAGGQRGDLFVGAALLSKKILDDIATPQQKSSLVLARPVS